MSNSLQDMAVQAVGLIDQAQGKVKHLYLLSLKDSRKNRKFFLVTSNPSYESGMIDVKGIYLDTEKDAETISPNKEDILSVKFPLANVNSITNLNYKAN